MNKYFYVNDYCNSEKENLFKKIRHKRRVIDKYFYVDENGTLAGLTEKGKKQKVLTIPDEVRFIGNSAFSDCSNLTNITIIESVKEIGSYAFENCINLKEVNFVKNSQLEKIGDWVFSHCSNLKEVIFPENSKLEKIGDWVFNKCMSLQNITIPNSVKEIGRSVIFDCKKLISDGVINNSSILFSWWVENHQYKEFGNQTIDQMIKKTGIIDLPQFKNSAGEEFSVIGNSAFEWCENLINIIFSRSLEMIDNYAFCNCKNLKKISFNKQSKLKIIGKNAFDGCENLTNIIVPGPVAKINSNVFKEVKRLLQIKQAIAIIYFQKKGSKLLNKFITKKKINIK